MTRTGARVRTVRFAEVTLQASRIDTGRGGRGLTLSLVLVSHYVPAFLTPFSEHNGQQIMGLGSHTSLVHHSCPLIITPPYASVRRQSRRLEDVASTIPKIVVRSFSLRSKVLEQSIIF